MHNATVFRGQNLFETTLEPMVEEVVEVVYVGDALVSLHLLAVYVTQLGTKGLISEEHLRFWRLSHGHLGL